MDYWAFDAYPEDCPLSYTLKTFLARRNRDRIRFCLFLVMGSAYGRFADDEAFQAYAARTRVKRPLRSGSTTDAGPFLHPSLKAEITLSGGNASPAKPQARFQE